MGSILYSQKTKPDLVHIQQSSLSQACHSKWHVPFREYSLNYNECVIYFILSLQVSVLCINLCNAEYHFRVYEVGRVNIKQVILAYK